MIYFSPDFTVIEVGTIIRQLGADFKQDGRGNIEIRPKKAIQPATLLKFPHKNKQHTIQGE